MAYQNVSTPRFYINILEWLSSTGVLTINNVYTTMPTTITEPTDVIDNEGIPLGVFREKSFAAFLGHTASSGQLNLSENYTDSIEINAELGVANQIICNVDGFSIRSFNGTGVDDNNTISTWHSSPIHSIVLGTYYDMPVAPDLSLSLEHDYSGIKKTTSMSGASFSNANWIKPPKWGDKEAWQLGDFPRPYSGRRIWDLSFSYISDTDLEPRNYTGTTESLEQGADNWFENVLHYTMGGHLPFIFQPNKDADYNWTDGDPSYINEIPEFAICRFDMNSFKREQVAPGVYNIKIKVKESW